ncbi:hypothetical protein JCGZ_26123 [Jatropha curcas]|uniref:Uncharacterized protein n=2 Tax=Jatropha curcas TaxID=180498 RepID=A0A067JEP4_JATCU|nr:hypothetical protein JCGZ_26123 [Jatropha curcas]
MKNFSEKLHNITTLEPPKQEEEKTKAIKHHKEEEGEEEERARCEWDFNLETVVSSSNSQSVSHALGAIEFDQSENFVATGGIARKIRIYSIKSLLPHKGSQYEHILSLDHANACDYYMCTPAKLSSLRWKPGFDSRIIGSGDYDGVVTEYDLERRLPVFERDEHGGHRVWSVDYSNWNPVVGASGSDDGTMQMWDPRCEDGDVATIQPSVTRSAVCCVEFNPFGGSMIAIGCADRKAYGYDIRMMVKPVIMLDGHRKTVTYVKFVDANTLVSASIDGCLKLWNLNESKMIRTYKGHVNNRNFVGLSVWRNGSLLACGSENNRIFVYDKRWGEPIWMQGFDTAGSSMENQEFVSSVCWRQVGEDKCTLIAGGSDGVLKVFQGKRKANTTPS